MTAKSKRNITIQKRVAFFTDANLVDGIFLNVERIPPLSQSKVSQLQIYFGVSDTLLDDDSFELYLIGLDANNPPDVGGVRFRALWAAMQRWHAATGGHLVDSMTHENLMIFGGGINNLQLATRTRDMFWSFFAELVAGTFTVKILGTVFVEHQLEIRNHPNDAYTFNKDPGFRNADGVSEIDMDQSASSGPF